MLEKLSSYKRRRDRSALCLQDLRLTICQAAGHFPPLWPKRN